MQVLAARRTPSPTIKDDLRTVKQSRQAAAVLRPDAGDVQTLAARSPFHYGDRPLAVGFARKNEDIFAVQRDDVGAIGQLGQLAVDGQRQIRALAELLGDRRI